MSLRMYVLNFFWDCLPMFFLQDEENSCRSSQGSSLEEGLTWVAILRVSGRRFSSATRIKIILQDLLVFLCFPLLVLMAHAGYGGTCGHGTSS